ncbi:formate dehydrogenase subunit delta [Novosphingobium sp.]|uniref:formate dehydrogenase subunit delta n=1 Tax=Novosphingobium sp. TaxID=1874826 RepID=UPI0027343FFD|nr:formate dehydrogenase subunit delta [Novosphingobium sp.]MDP3908707.1 formate dehydrogenase subunit delta [Novosphingobium sp.]
MAPERLIHLANQIARNLAAQGEEAAIIQTEQHIREFWDPNMRAAIKNVDRSSLSPIAAAAIAALSSHHQKRPNSK